MVRKCSFANCGEREDLVKRRNTRVERDYWYCESHDPMEDDAAAWQFVEVDDD